MTTAEQIQFIMDCYIECPRDVQLAIRNVHRAQLLKKGWLPEAAEKWVRDNCPLQGENK